MKIEDIVKFEALTRLNNSGELVDCRIEFKDGTVIEDSKQSRVAGQRNEVQTFLSSLPRTTSALTCPKVKILDKTWTLGHAYQNDEEREKTSARGSGSGSGAVNKKAAYEEALNLVQKLEEAKCPKEFLDTVRKYAESLKPVDPAVAKARAALAALTPEQKKLLGL